MSAGRSRRIYDEIVIIEDAFIIKAKIQCETMPISHMRQCEKINDMFISVNRCEVGKVPGKTGHHGKQHIVIASTRRHRRGHPRVLVRIRKYNGFILPAMEDCAGNTVTCKINKSIRTPGAYPNRSCVIYYLSTELSLLSHPFAASRGKAFAAAWRSAAPSRRFLR